MLYRGYMNQTKYEISELNKIEVERMNFRVISRHPKFPIEVTDELKKDVGKELYLLLKKYQ